MNPVTGPHLTMPQSVLVHDDFTCDFPRLAVRTAHRLPQRRWEGGGRVKTVRTGAQASGSASSVNPT